MRNITININMHRKAFGCGVTDSLTYYLHKPVELDNAVLWIIGMEHISWGNDLIAGFSGN